VLLASALDFLGVLEKRGLELDDFDKIKAACGSSIKMIKLLY